jgi:hypothetical protein
VLAGAKVTRQYSMRSAKIITTAKELGIVADPLTELQWPLLAPRAAQRRRVDEGPYDREDED